MTVSFNEMELQLIQHSYEVFQTDIVWYEMIRQEGC